MAHAIRFLNISELYSSMSYKKVIVSMPEFCCDSKLNLKEYCKELGITRFLPMTLTFLRHPERG